MLYAKHYLHHLVKRFVRLYNVRRLERQKNKNKINMIRKNRSAG